MAFLKHNQRTAVHENKFWQYLQYFCRHKKLCTGMCPRSTEMSLLDLKFAIFLEISKMERWLFSLALQYTFVLQIFFLLLVHKNIHSDRGYVSQNELYERKGSREISFQCGLHLVNYWTHCQDRKHWSQECSSSGIGCILRK